METPAVFQVEPLNRRKRIPMKTIRALADLIAKKFNPEQIILFGSHVYGKPTAWSDVDLLVVMDTPKGEMDAILEVADTLPDLQFRVDIIVRSRAVLEKRKKLGDWFLREITAKGKVLYERNNPGMG
jgi:predicted nucleotidyltransferase